MTVTEFKSVPSAANLPTGPLEDHRMFPAISQVDAYWEGLQDGRMMPERSEIDPRGLESALEYAFILEVLAPGMARMRVAGLHLNDLLGMEVRGMPIASLFAVPERKKLTEALNKVVNLARVADLTVSSPSGPGRSKLNGRMYLAPLGNGGGGFPRILGALQTHGQLGDAPRYLDISETRYRRTVPTHPIGQSKFASKNSLEPGFAEQAATFGQQSAKASGVAQSFSTIGRGHLRLVTSKD